MQNEESKVGGTAEQHKHKRGNKSTDRNIIKSNEIFCSRGMYSSEEKGQAALEEWKGNGGVAALKPSGDKCMLLALLAMNKE